jgi:site-specific recombinase XerD
MTNLEIIEKFLKSNSCSELGESTTIQYRNELIKAFEVMGNVNFADLKMVTLQDYTDYLSETYSNSSSYNKKLAPFRKFIKYIVAYELNTNIKLDMFLQEFGTKKQNSRLGKGDIPLTIEEYFAFNKFVIEKKATSWLVQRQKVVTLLMSTLGLRRIEVQFLLKSSIDFDKLTVNPNKTKGDKPRQILLPLSERVAAEIKSLYDFYDKEGIIGDYVIMDRNGSYLKDVKNINTMINGKTVVDEDGNVIASSSNGIVGMALRRGIIKTKALPHSLRKSYGMVLRHYFNKDLEYVRDILGHESVMTTEIYTQLHIHSEDREDVDLFNF